MNDLIDRRSAIAYAISGMVRTEDGEKWIRTKEVRQSLLNMPPAQPERKRGIHGGGEVMKEVEERNPKNVVMEWAKSIQRSAYRGQQCLKERTATNTQKGIDSASDYFGEIIGQCNAILTVLDNTR